MKYKLGDTVKLYEKVNLDCSEEAMKQILHDVLAGKAPPDNYKLLTLTTQEMVDKYNKTGII